MSHFKVLILCIVFNGVATDNDREYCNTVSPSTNYYENYVHSDGAKTLSSRIYSTKGRSELIIHEPDTGTLTLSLGNSNGEFEKSSDEISNSARQFCPGGEVFSADINGDKKEDLLCHTSDNSFFVKYHYRNTFSYYPQRRLDASVTCADLVKIGDFDGNGVDDIMCFSFDGITSSQIFFNDKPLQCNIRYLHPVHRYSPSRYHYRRYSAYYSAQFCNPKLLRAYTFTADSLNADCDFSVDEVIVVNANRDNRDDLVCHHSADMTFTLYISSGSTIGNTFTTAAASITTCDIAENVIHASDVDGDGDHDIVCASYEAGSTQNAQVSFYSGGVYLDFTTFPSDCETFCVEATATSPAIVEYAFGDFNGDKADDMMCRYEDLSVGGMVTNFVYSNLV